MAFSIRAGAGFQNFGHGKRGHASSSAQGPKGARTTQRAVAAASGTPSPGALSQVNVIGAWPVVPAAVVVGVMTVASANVLTRLDTLERRVSKVEADIKIMKELLGKICRKLRV